MTELSPEESESVTGGYGKSISHVIIGLKTVKGTKQLKLDPTIYDALIKEKVSSEASFMPGKFLWFYLILCFTQCYSLVSCHYREELPKCLCMLHCGPILKDVL